MKIKKKMNLDKFYKLIKFKLSKLINKYSIKILYFTYFFYQI